MSLLDMTLQHAFLYYLSSKEEGEEEELPNFQEVTVQTESTAAEMTGKLQNKPVDFGSKLTYWQICTWTGGIIGANGDFKHGYWTWYQISFNGGFGDMIRAAERAGGPGEKLHSRSVPKILQLINYL